jgi:hypothetical protein
MPGLKSSDCSQSLCDAVQDYCELIIAGEFMDWGSAVKAEKDNYTTEGDTASLVKRGKLSFTRRQDKFLTQFGMPGKVILLYDPAYRVIGLKPCAQDDPRGYQITRSKDRPWHSRSISISGLCNRYSIKITRRLVCDVVNRDGVLEVHLDKDEAATPKKYNWEEVGKNLKTTFLKPRITIMVHKSKEGRKSYDLSFNEVVFQTLGCPQYVEAGYDPGAKQIGLRAAPSNTATSRAVRSSFGSNPGVCFPTYLIAFSGLVSTAQLGIEKSIRFEPALDDGFVTFFLVDGVAVKSAPGRPQKLFSDKDAELFKRAVVERDEYARSHKGARITRNQLAARLRISERSLTDLYQRLGTNHKQFLGPNPRRRPSSDSGSVKTRKTRKQLGEHERNSRRTRKQ